MKFHKAILAAVLMAAGMTAVGQQQTFDGLKVSVISWRWSSGAKLFIELRLENITSESGRAQQIAVAYQPHSDRPCDDTGPVASMTDGAGNNWWSVTVSGLSCGSNADNWLNIRPGGSVPITYMFKGNQLHGVAPPFHLTAELKLFKFDNKKHQRVPISLGPMGAGPEQVPLYPTPYRN